MTLLSVVNPNDLCKQILQLDRSIRFAGVANMKGKLVAQAYREGLIPLLTKQETELSALQAKKLGKTMYAFAHYEKLNRATISLIDDPRSDYVLLVSFDLNAEHESIILHKILPLVRKDRTK